MPSAKKSSPSTKSKAGASAPVINWSEVEWTTLVGELDRTLPDRRLKNVTDPLDLPVALADVHAAMRRVLPKERWRVMKDIKRVKSKLWLALNALQGDAQATMTEDPADQVELAAAATAQPAEAPQEAVPFTPSPDLVPSASKREDMHWTKFEWRKLAKELMKAAPHTDFLRPNGSNSITAQDIQKAQLILRPERQRSSTSPSRLALDRMQLHRAFANIKGELFNVTPAGIAKQDKPGTQPAAEQPQQAPLLLAAPVAEEPAAPVVAPEPIPEAPAVEAAPVTEAAAPMVEELPPAAPVEVVPAKRPHGSLPGEQVGLAKIWWTDTEWQTLAAALITLYPRAGFDKPGGLERLTGSHFRNAMETALPPERQRGRGISHIAGLRKHLAKPMAFLAKAKDAAPAATTEEAAPATAHAEASVTPAALDPYRAKDLLPRLPDGRNTGAPKQKIFWTDQDVYLIARELMEMNPYGGWLDSKQLVNLKGGDVYVAQRVLDTDRRRTETACKPLAALRPRLVAAFAKVKRELGMEDAKKQKAEADARLAEEQAQLARLREQAAADVAQQAEQARIAAANAPVTEDVIAKVLSGTGTGALVELLLGRLMTVAENRIEAAIERGIAAGLSSPAVREALQVRVEFPNAPPAPGQQPRVEAANGMPATRRPHVGVVGNRCDFEHDLKREFPQLQFTVTDNANASGAAIRNCDKVIVMTKFISHATDRVVKDAVKDRYCPVNGGLSSVKHQLDVWLRSGTLKSQPAHH